MGEDSDINLVSNEQHSSDDQVCRQLRAQNINSSSTLMRRSGSNRNSGVRHDNHTGVDKNIVPQRVRQCNSDDTSDAVDDVDDVDNSTGTTGEGNNGSEWFSLSSSAQIEATLSAYGSQLVGLESSPLLSRQQIRLSSRCSPLLPKSYNDNNRRTLYNEPKETFGHRTESNRAKQSAHDLTKQMRPKDFVAKYGNIRWLGVLLFVFACMFCVYMIVYLNTISREEKTLYVTHLRLVNLFGRHGDRGPSDSLPKNDKHREILDRLWPNGLSNLTQAGRLRQYRIGLELRRRYGHLLGWNSSWVSAFSSPIYRCQESVAEILRGLYDNEQLLKDGLDFIERCEREKSIAASQQVVANESLAVAVLAANKSSHLYRYHYHHHRNYCHLRGGSGSPLEWKNVEIDTRSIPALTWAYLNQCPYRIANPSPIDKDLTKSDAVASLRGLARLRQVIKQRYNLDFNMTALGLWSTLAAEIRAERTKSTYDYGRQLYDWVTEHVDGYNKSKISLFDLYEEVAVLAYRDRIVGTANWIQLSPIVSSIVGSQLVALNKTQEANELQLGSLRYLRINNDSKSGNVNTGNGTSSEIERPPSVEEMFSHKRMIIYSSHDSIMQLLMHRLKLIKADANEFEQRYNKWHSESRKQRAKLAQIMSQMGGHILGGNEYNEVINYDSEMFLDGIKMSSFGASLAFELWQIERLAPRDNSPGGGGGGGNVTGGADYADYASESESESESESDTDSLDTGYESGFGRGGAGKRSGGRTGAPVSKENSFAYVQAVLYNREDGKYDPIVYKRLALGSVCRQLFREQNRNVAKRETETSLEKFYEFFATANDSDDTGAYGSGHGISVDSESASDHAYRSASDRTHSCPFELFRNVTANLMLDINKMIELCATSQVH